MLKSLLLGTEWRILDCDLLRFEAAITLGSGTHRGARFSLLGHRCLTGLLKRFLSENSRG